MAKNNLEKQVYEDFRLGKRIKSRFFNKTSKGVWFGVKGGKEAILGPKSLDQRSIAKISYMKNRYQKQWGVHGRYLARQGAQMENKPGLGFDSNDENLNIPKTLNIWQEAGDPRIWKIIISPEMAHKLDLKEHVRDVMQLVEKDLGAKLEWIAIYHYNTDNPHAHIVIRGVDRDGKELLINKEYFTKGFRQRSIEVATQKLGLRLEQDILSKRQENIKALHLTEMDREIKHKLTKDSFINFQHKEHGSFINERELQLKGRVMFLEEIGLAKKDSNVSWHVDPGFIDYLKFVQTQKDIVKTKNRHIKNILNPTLPVVLNKLENIGDTLIGRVVGMGLSESNNEPRYMLIEGIDNKIHYVLATEGMTKKRDGGDLRNGEIIYLERRQFLKERQHQEPQKIRYVFAESFQSFVDIVQAPILNDIDLFILNKLQESQRMPKINQFDGEVRKQFFEIMSYRIELMQKFNLIRPDRSINLPKLEWTIHNDSKLERGRGLGLGGL